MLLSSKPSEILHIGIDDFGANVKARILCPTRQPEDQVRADSKGERQKAAERNVLARIRSVIGS
jgi:hypothetical protein